MGRVLRVKIRVFLEKIVIIEFNCHFYREMIRFFIETFTNIFLKPCSSNISALCAAGQVLT